MKVTAVIEDGVLQFVMHPETKTDKALLDMVPKNGKCDAEIKRGAYYRCQGGWYRQSGVDDQSSLILVVDHGTK